MAAITSIVVNDRESTPVAHTFVPRSVVNPNGRMFARAAAVVAGDEKITLTTRVSGKRTINRVLLVVPILSTETVGGVPISTVVRTSVVDAEFKFEDGSTAQERANVVGMFYNALAASQTAVLKTVADGEAVF